ncbi:MAG: hypothetical protein HYW05_05495 [Candidatus Diapherotrites archaeon]|nr:hypothetical protein [Candidatus Diapherotrites archaeon]
MGKATAIIALIVLIQLQLVFAANMHGSMKIFAVTTSGEGLSADLILYLEKGSGEVWSTVTPLVGTSTQTAERVAVQVAKDYSKEANGYDYKFDIDSDAAVVDGPSAGAAMALLTIALLQGKQIPKNVSLTGTINEAGEVGGVGGVYEKSKEAAAVGIKLFMIPRGEAQQIVKLPEGVRSIDLTSYAPVAWGMKVIEVSDIDESLKYAFTDINAIDVNVEDSGNIPLFVPNAIGYARQLEPLRVLTSRYLKEANELITSARDALSGTLLEDPALVDSMLGSLNDAERNIKHAELLFDQNYLYSAANNAFVSKVNASLVKDIAENPSLFSSNSPLLETKLNELMQDIERLKADVNYAVPIDYLEWHIAAEERLSWAELNVNKLLTTQTIAIGGDEISQYTIILKNIQDYEFAVAWYNAAKDFYTLGKSSEKLVALDNKFKNYSSSYIVNTENNLSILSQILSPEQLEDIERRVKASKLETAGNLHLGSAFDAASALALANAAIATNEKDLNGLYTILESSIKRMESAMTKSSHAGKLVWVNLYLDHAKYYLEAANFYYSQGEGSAAKERLVSGISLAYLAENIFAVSEDIYEYYDAIPASKYIKQKNAAEGFEFNFEFALSIAIIALVILFIAIALLLAIRLAKSHKAGVPAEAANIKYLQHSLDEALMHGKISEERYAELSEKYAQQIADNEASRKQKGEHLIIIDRLRAELLAMEHTLHSLKIHYKEGLLSEDAYHRYMEKYHRRMDALKNALEKEARQISGRQPLLEAEDIEEKPKKIIFEETLKKREKEEKPKAQKKRQTGKKMKSKKGRKN